MANLLPFTKMHGLGNCYIYVDGFEHCVKEADLPALARESSDPNTGIGADGLIVMVPSEKAPVKMRIFNKDGSEARNCGNGLRCVAKYVYEKGRVNDKTFPIETLSGLVQANVYATDGIVNEVMINMGKPAWRSGDLPMKTDDPNQELIDVPLEVAGKSAMMTGVSMGNPHGVFFVDTIDEAPVEKYGPILADHHPLFPDGINVEFVEMAGPNEMHFRVWERGSGVTRACGTGACAAVVAAVLNGKTKRDEEVHVHLLGGDLKIRWSKEGSVHMTGPAVKICEGVYYAEHL